MHTRVGREHAGAGRLVDFGIVGRVKLDQADAVDDRDDDIVIVSVVVQAAEPVLIGRAGVGERYESEQQQHIGEHIRTPEGVLGMSANVR